MEITSGHLRLEKLAFWGRHGLLPFERESGNRFEVDVDLQVDLTEAVRTDQIESTVDLEKVYGTIRRIVEGDPCPMLETVANNIAVELVRLDKVQSCTIRVRKMNPPLPGATGGIMEAEITRVP